MRRVALSFALIFATCTNEAPQATPAENAEAAPPTNPTAAIANEPAYVTTSTTQRKQPTDAPKIDEAGKQVSNYLATLYRGEQVTMLKQEGDWVNIKASGDSEGWVKTDDLLAASGISMATTLEEVKTFDRPDYSALNVNRTLPLGSLLLVTKVKEPFSEVNFQGTRRVWMLTEKLATETNEIEAARLVSRARWHDDKKNPEAAKKYWDVARSTFGTTKLMAALDAPAGQPEGAAPAPAPAPETQATANGAH